MPVPGAQTAGRAAAAREPQPRAGPLNAVRSERVRNNRRFRRADMSGLILLVFLAVIVAFGFTRLRGKMKLGVTSKHWTTVIVLFVLVVLIAYAAHSGH
jgi:heme A synthase